MDISVRPLPGRMMGSEKIYSLAYATYAAYMEKMGEDCYQPKVYANHEFEFDYSGRSGEYENVSLCDVLNGTIDPRVFKDCIVFVGAYAPGMQVLSTWQYRGRPRCTVWKSMQTL